MTRPLPAGQHTVRRHNSALVLGAIAESPGSSRAGVAARTGLTKATVSSLVDRMVAAGLVSDTGPEQRTGPGRPGSALFLSPAGPHGLGLEIGVDYLATCLVDLTGTVRRRWVRPADHRNAPAGAVLAEAAGVVVGALAEAGRLGVRVGGLGVAVPGLVEAATGLLRVAPNLGWRDVDVPAELRRAADLGDLPILTGNEANFAALAELAAGGPADFVHVSAEIGIGAGVVVGGTVFEGVHGFGGEIGHFAVDPGGPACSCGGRGCLERLAGQDAILRDADAPDVDTLVERLAADDPAAGRAVGRAARWLGIALGNVIGLLDVPAVVLGGAYARLHPWLADPLTTELGTRVLSSAWSPVSVLPSVLGGEAAVRGAAASAVRAIVADPDPFVEAAG
ncbi:Sugar kinase of the NBD/HSP70 family, may contain an N-terminal HTH domain [Amycolatopsis arida]|uniref:Sugar kinase of the NBD/HSP70 family, may contain an N-terminal HTH domain n=1 Tax=Amycolatopsis arida TaxID=587909 RepID=A0A1I5ZR61_9PSEU|nr:ROK family transcriptional regulator [Amycolatopsis arida]TDX89283.1 putative NBD/HSP70 family sugar kinase [Amycolatopsis arida]SFQ58677.1 Sugar kinase of the NBD/HSP70 family, may contain an N-terminal HTH domain [Amycolatopsis arida]